MICQYPMKFVRGITKICGHTAMAGERYCADHVWRVVNRTNVAGEIMPDYPDRDERIAKEMASSQR
jgi:hypothetical protein